MKTLLKNAVCSSVRAAHGAILLSYAFVNFANAVTTNWLGFNTLFTDTSNWSVGVPGTTDTAVFNIDNVINQTSMGAFVVTGQGSRWTNNGNLTVGNLGAGTLTLSDGGEVVVTDALSASTASRVVLDGGTLTVNQFGVGGIDALDWRSGTLHLTSADGLSVGPGGLFGSSLALNQNQVLEVDEMLNIETGSALYAGAGVDAGSIDIAVGGQMLLGGTQQQFGTGTVNAGHLVLMDSTFVDGPVTNTAGGAITVLSEVTFNDLVDGPGGYFGPGSITFAGDFSPGNSAALVTFETDVAVAGDGALHIELGGIERGSQYDALEIAGEASLGGMLVVSLIDGFTPAVGNAFEILHTEDGIADDFDAMLLPALSTGLGWNVVYSDFSVVLELATVGLPGDFDNDGDVDGRDFLIWQRGGSPDPLSGGDLDAWQANYGTGLLAGVEDDPARWEASPVPEPGGLSLLWLAFAAQVFVAKRT